MSETVGQWKARKSAQARKFVERDPNLTLDNHGDYETKFVLVHHIEGAALVIGQLERNSLGQPKVDATDDDIEAWAAPLRAWMAKADA